MKAVYLETSAVLAWLLGQKGGKDARAAVDAADAVATSALTFAEVERALRRGVASGTFREADAQRLRGLVARVRGAWIVMEVTATVLERAGRAFPAEPVRTLDAIHLATALAFAEAFPDLGILSLDERIGANARELGL